MTTVWGNKMDPVQVAIIARKLPESVFTRFTKVYPLLKEVAGFKTKLEISSTDGLFLLVISALTAPLTHLFLKKIVPLLSFLEVNSDFLVIFAVINFLLLLGISKLVKNIRYRNEFNQKTLKLLWESREEPQDFWKALVFIALFEPKLAEFFRKTLPAEHAKMVKYLI